MSRIIKESYLFLILFFLVLLKEPLINMINIDINKCNYDYEILLNEYNKLLNFSKIDVIYKVDYINTYILNKNIYNYLNEITIKGGNDLKLNNNPVIYNNTLVGIVSKVNKNTSIVKLLTNNNSKISVKINNEVGLLKYKNNELIVENISNYSTISIGDKIYTSGLGNIKENIYIGTVKNIKLNNKNIEKTIIVSYDIDIKDINYITILRENIWYIYY